MEAAVCALETEDVPTLSHTCRCATLGESENPRNTREGSDEHTHAPKLHATEMRAKNAGILHTNSSV